MDAPEATAVKAATQLRHRTEDRGDDGSLSLGKCVTPHIVRQDALNHHAMLVAILMHKHIYNVVLHGR